MSKETKKIGIMKLDCVLFSRLNIPCQSPDENREEWWLPFLCQMGQLKEPSSSRSFLWERYIHVPWKRNAKPCLVPILLDNSSLCMEVYRKRLAEESSARNRVNGVKSRHQRQCPLTGNASFELIIKRLGFASYLQNCTILIPFETHVNIPIKKSQK